MLFFILILQGKTLVHSTEIQLENTEKNQSRESCDLSCSDQCKYIDNKLVTDCYSLCGCEYINEPLQYKTIDGYGKEEEIIVMKYLKSLEQKSISSCKQSCDRFCRSINGDFLCCNSECNEKFCEELELDSLKIIFLSLLSGVLVWVLYRMALKKLNLENYAQKYEFGYQKF